MTTQQKLDEARTALHELILGKKAVTVTFNGRTVTFTQTNITSLRNYIAELEIELGTYSRRSGPAGVMA